MGLIIVVVIIVTIVVIVVIKVIIIDETSIQKAADALAMLAIRVPQRDRTPSLSWLVVGKE